MCEERNPILITLQQLFFISNVESLDWALCWTINNVWFGTQRTVVINAVYEAHSNLCMVVSHQDDVKQLLAVWVELPQSRVDRHQRLCERTECFTPGYWVRAFTVRLQCRLYNIRTTGFLQLSRTVLKEDAEALKQHWHAGIRFINHKGLRQDCCLRLH